MAASSPSECNAVGSSYLLGNGHCIEETYDTHAVQQGSLLEDCFRPPDKTTASPRSSDSGQSEMDTADTVIVRPTLLTVKETMCSDKSISTTSAPAWHKEEDGVSADLITNAMPAIVIKDSKYSEPSCDFDDSDVGDEDFDAVAQDFQTDGSAQDDFASYEAAISRDDSLVRIYAGGEDGAQVDLYIIEDSEDFTIRTKVSSPQVLEKEFSAKQTEAPDRQHYLVDEVENEVGTMSVVKLAKVCDGNTADQKEKEETSVGDIVNHTKDKEICDGNTAEHRENKACDRNMVECIGDKEMHDENTVEHKEEEDNSLEEEDSLYFEYLSDDAVSFASKVSTAEISAGGATVTAADSGGKEPVGQLDSIPSDEEDFYDALDHQVEKEFDVALPHNKEKHHRRTASDLSMESYANDLSSESESEGSVNEARVYTTKANSPKKGLQRQGSGRRDHKRTGSQDKIRMPRSAADYQNTVDGTVVPRRQRRKWIYEKPNISLNLWSVMKNCIGKELSKIPMPVNFNEPLSMLQRLTEELEYSEILDQAALCDDSCEQLAYVAAFTVSAYATTLFRTGKPFNPLLGETFEFDRTDDFGWRSLAEQVSHHPPTLATHTEGRGWTLWQEFTMTTKFRGRYLQIIPMGIAHLTFTKSGGHYTWRKVTTTVHNIIVGRLWVDNQGEMDITNHTTGDRCHLKYSAYSYFSRESPRKVTGVVTDSKDNARWVLTGNWCTKMDGAPIIHVEESNKGKPVFETGPHKLLWKVRPPPNGAERIYFFSQLAIEMNEPEEGVAPTDSRNRPDQRLMEEGKWDEANHMKIMLEEKQRGTRRQRETDMEKARSEGKEVKPYTATWFKKELDPITGNLMHVFNHKYWDCKAKQQWDMCPSIFL